MGQEGVKCPTGAEVSLYLTHVTRPVSKHACCFYTANVYTYTIHCRVTLIENLGTACFNHILLCKCVPHKQCLVCCNCYASMKCVESAKFFQAVKYRFILNFR